MSRLRTCFPFYLQAHISVAATLLMVVECRLVPLLRLVNCHLHVPRSLGSMRLTTGVGGRTGWPRQWAWCGSSLRQAVRLCGKGSTAQGRNGLTRPAQPSLAPRLQQATIYEAVYTCNDHQTFVSLLANLPVLTTHTPPTHNVKRLANGMSRSSLLGGMNPFQTAPGSARR